MAFVQIIASSNDGYIVQGSSYVTGVTNLVVGNTSSTNQLSACWIPFSVNLLKNTTIVSAVFAITAITTVTVNSQNYNIAVGVHNSVNSPQPSTYSQLVGYTYLQSTYYFASHTAGTILIFDFTTAVSTLIANVSWTPNNVIAIVMKDNGSQTNKNYQFAASENTTYTKPTLEINYIVPGGQFKTLIIGL